MTPSSRTLACLCFLVGWAPTPAAAQDEKPLKPGVYAKLETSKGEMVLRLLYRHVPRTVNSFVDLIEGRKQFTDAQGNKVTRPFYDGLTFHRVIKNFMIQGGCVRGTGSSKAIPAFLDETKSQFRHTGPGVLSMANSDGPGKRPWSNTGRSNGTQFFITLKATPHLDGKHTVFGKLVRGEKTLRKIGSVETGPGDKPLKKVTIKKASVLRVRPKLAAPKGEPAKAALPVKGSPARAKTVVHVICLQYDGCRRAGPMARGHTVKQALATAKSLVALARQPKAEFLPLARTWSDLPRVTFTMTRAKNDPSLEPAFRLSPGQVSDPVETPYGVMIFQAK